MTHKEHDRRHEPDFARGLRRGTPAREHPDYARGLDEPHRDADKYDTSYGHGLEAAERVEQHRRPDYARGLDHEAEDD